jgi:hypothetical protein
VPSRRLQVTPGRGRRAGVPIAQKGGKSGAEGWHRDRRQQGRIRWFHQLVNR